LVQKAAVVASPVVVADRAAVAAAQVAVVARAAVVVPAAAVVDAAAPLEVAVVVREEADPQAAVVVVVTAAVEAEAPVAAVVWEAVVEVEVVVVVENPVVAVEVQVEAEAWAAADRQAEAVVVDAPVAVGPAAVAPPEVVVEWAAVDRQVAAVAARAEVEAAEAAKPFPSRRGVALCATPRFFYRCTISQPFYSRCRGSFHHSSPGFGCATRVLSMMKAMRLRSTLRSSASSYPRATKLTTSAAVSRRFSPAIIRASRSSSSTTIRQMTLPQLHALRHAATRACT
jgi:hypothetical protein